MKIELFVLPSVMRKDFMDAFVLSRDEIFCLYPSLEENLYREGIDPCEWYDTAYLWDKMSPDMPEVSFAEALARLRSRQGSVLIMSESEDSHKPGALIHHGRPMSDFVAIVDPLELADRIEYEWLESARLLWEEGSFLTDGILPDDLYVFDTTLDWVIVFTHESDPGADGTRESASSRLCLAFGI